MDGAKTSPLDTFFMNFCVSKPFTIDEYAYTFTNVLFSCCCWCWSWSVDWIARARLKFLKEWLSFVHALKVTWRFTKKIKRKNAKQFRIVFEFLPLFPSIYEWFSSFADVQVALKYMLSHTTWRIRCCLLPCLFFFSRSSFKRTCTCTSKHQTESSRHNVSYFKCINKWK